MRRLLLLLSLSAAAVASAADAPAKPAASPETKPAAPRAVTRRDPEIRLLCVADDLPLRYVKNARGQEIPVFAGFDEEPPNTVYVKRSGAFKPAPMPRNAVGKPHSDGDARTGKIEGYFIKPFAAMDMASSWAKSAAAISAQQKGAPPPTTTGPEAKPPAEEWAQLASPPPQDGKDYLMCLYQPLTTAKWFPPKVKYVDVSPAAAPAGAVIVVNLSDRNAVVRIGAGKPQKLAPGDQVTVSAPGFDTAFPVAVAARGRTGDELQVMPSRPRTLPAGHCGVVILYSMYERTSEKPVGVRFSSYEVPPPRLSN